MMPSRGSKPARADVKDGDRHAAGVEGGDGRVTGVKDGGDRATGGRRRTTGSETADHGPPSEHRRNRETQRRLLRESRAARLPLIGTVGLGLVTVALIIAQAVLLARVIAAVFMDGAGFDQVAGDLIALAAISLGRGLADAGFEATGRIGAARVMGELRMRLAEHALRWPLRVSGRSTRPGRGEREAAAVVQEPLDEAADAWVDGDPPGAGELVAAAIDGVDSLEAWFARYLPQVVLSVLAPLAILAWLIPLDWPAALVLLITAPLIPIFMILIGLATEHRARRRWRLMARLASHFLDRVSGLATLRIHGLAEAQTEAIARAGESYRRETMATLRIGFLSALVLELLAMLGTAVVAATVGIQLAGGHLELATGLCVLLLAPELYMPLRRLGSEFHAGAEGMAAAERIFTALDADRPSAPSPAAKPYGDERGEGTDVTGVTQGADTEVEDRAKPPAPDAGALIELRDVSFRYAGRERVLDRADLVVGRGERLAIVGDSGSGKSTLFALILGLLQPQYGQILLGDQPTGRPTAATGAGTLTADHDAAARPLDLTRDRDRDLTAWHRQVAWVPQRPILISGTLADNVRLIAPEATDEDVERAIFRAGLAEVVRGLERGRETKIGEAGRRLSAGQRQRVALARAFLRDAPVVLLDEPTAHLDRETAADVARAIEELLRGRTALIASHRPEAIEGADRVLRLEAGRFFPVDHLSGGKRGEKERLAVPA